MKPGSVSALGWLILGDDVQAGPLATSDALYLNLDESDPTQSVERARAMF